MDIYHVFLTIVCVYLLFSLQRSKKRADIWEDMATRLYHDAKEVFEAVKKLEMSTKTTIERGDER